MFSGSVYFEGDEGVGRAALTAAYQYANLVRQQKEANKLTNLTQTTQLFPGVWVTVFDGEHTQSMTVRVDDRSTQPKPRETATRENTHSYVYLVFYEDQTVIRRTRVDGPFDGWEDVVSYSPSIRPGDPVFAVASDRVFYVTREILPSGSPILAEYHIRVAGREEPIATYRDGRLVKNITAGDGKVFVMFNRLVPETNFYNLEVDVLSFSGEPLGSYSLGELNDSASTDWLDYYRGALYFGAHINDIQIISPQVQYQYLQQFIELISQRQACEVALCKYELGNDFINVLFSREVPALIPLPTVEEVIAESNERIALYLASHPEASAPPPTWPVFMLGMFPFTPSILLRGGVGYGRYAETYQTGKIHIRDLQDLSSSSEFDVREDSAMVSPTTNAVVCQDRVVALSTQGDKNGELRIYTRSQTGFEYAKKITLDSYSSREIEVDRDGFYNKTTTTLEL